MLSSPNGTKLFCDTSEFIKTQTCGATENIRVYAEFLVEIHGKLVKNLGCKIAIRAQIPVFFSSLNISNQNDNAHISCINAYILFNK